MPKCATEQSGEAVRASDMPLPEAIVSGGAAVAAVPVTPEMVRAGLYEWGEFRFLSDPGEIVTAIYTAMEYERLGVRE